MTIINTQSTQLLNSVIHYAADVYLDRKGPWRPTNLPDMDFVDQMETIVNWTPYLDQSYDPQ